MGIQETRGKSTSKRCTLKAYLEASGKFSISGTVNLSNLLNYSQKCHNFPKAFLLLDRILIQSTAKVCPSLVSDLTLKPQGYLKSRAGRMNVIHLDLGAQSTLDGLMCPIYLTCQITLLQPPRDSLFTTSSLEWAMLYPQR